jgi:hypothetical protein
MDTSNAGSLPVERAIDIVNRKVDELYVKRAQTAPGSTEWVDAGFKIAHTLRLLEKARQRARWFYHIRDHK